jgi:hypothetical protein
VKSGRRLFMLIGSGGVSMKWYIAVTRVLHIWPLILCAVNRQGPAPYSGGATERVRGESVVASQRAASCRVLAECSRASVPGRGSIHTAVRVRTPVALVR